MQEKHTYTIYINLTLVKYIYCVFIHLYTYSGYIHTLYRIYIYTMELYNKIHICNNGYK